MIKKILAYILIGSLLLTMLSGCGTKKTTTTIPEKDSLVYAIPADPSTFDAMNVAMASEILINNNIYSRLVVSDGAGGFKGDLAESWTNDEMSYTFVLKKGVKFHNGEELKAIDAVFSITAAKESPYMASYSGAIKDAVVIDDYSFVINLLYPYAPFIASINQISIENQKAVTDAGKDYGQNPVGTGPYKFVSHSTGQNVKLERFDDYFNGAVPIKNVEFRVITDSNTTLASLKAGEIDIANDLPEIAMEELKKDPKFTLHPFPALHIYYVIMNNSIKPFDNVLVRQAINYAIDKDSLVTAALEGNGAKANTIINEATFGYSAKIKGYEYDVKKAKDLLTQAGYPNGFEATFKTMDGTFKKAAELVQGDLSKIGITLNLEMVEANTYFQDLQSGNYEMGNMAITLSPDADDWQMVFSSTGGFNLQKYNNPKVDTLFSDARKLLDKNQRLAKYEELLQILENDAPIVPLFFPTNYFTAKSDLKFGTIDPNGTIDVTQMEWIK